MERVGSRASRAATARETVDIVLRGEYTAPSHKTVHLAAAVAACHSGTQYIAAHAQLPPLPDSPNLDTKFIFRQQSTLQVSRAIAASGVTPCSLNFASAKHPGGGFLGGSSAQEESLARNSALYSSLILPVCQDYYALNKRLKQPLRSLYTDAMIYSPNCPVFRDDAGSLLEEFYLTSFITCPAPNVGALKPRTPENVQLARDVLRARAHRLLHVVAMLGHKVLVLGAWGCGVFRNDPRFVAGMFKELLTGPFKGRFQEVYFAVIGADNIEPFAEQFGS